jgi:dihydrofolate synthase/folylpolyglutamate synthase
MRQAKWPARMQTISSGLLWTAAGSGKHRLVIDGAHNANAGRAIADSLPDDQPIYLVYGLLATKDAQGFVQPLLPKVSRAVAVEIPGAAASLSAHNAASAAGHAAAETAPSIAAALETLRDEEPGMILVCGSLYLAGAFLAENQGVAVASGRKAV